MKGLIFAAVIYMAQVNALDFSSLPSSPGGGNLSGQSPEQTESNAQLPAGGGVTPSEQDPIQQLTEDGLSSKDASVDLTLQTLDDDNTKSGEDVEATEDENCDDELALAGDDSALADKSNSSEDGKTTEDDDCDDELPVAEEDDCNEDYEMAEQDECSEELDVAESDDGYDVAGPDTDTKTQGDAGAKKSDDAAVKGNLEEYVDGANLAGGDAGDKTSDDAAVKGNLEVYGDGANLAGGNAGVTPPDGTSENGVTDESVENAKLTGEDAGTDVNVKEGNENLDTSIDTSTSTDSTTDTSLTKAGDVSTESGTELYGGAEASDGDDDCDDGLDVAGDDECKDGLDVAGDDECDEELVIADNDDMKDELDSPEGKVDDDINLDASAAAMDQTKLSDDLMTSSSSTDTTELDLMQAPSPVAAESAIGANTGSTPSEKGQYSVQQTALSAESPNLASTDKSNNFSATPFVAAAAVCVALGLVGVIYMKRRRNKSKKERNDIFTIDKNSAL